MDVTHKVGLEESRQTVYKILWSVDIVVEILLVLTCRNLLVVEVRHITVEAVEVHSLLVCEGECR